MCFVMRIEAFITITCELL
ncbi:hypothetical protein CFIMG_006546RA [Ceratocystis fimbriata CBS 114723]|uniref:Uncharacterized protein n=1 Tax=Ceratocystis fimbriata CBS 114723 TaxID=1035309 RepID=A0A2C5WUA2_9PEZI|nr:hypothetical protein CFIMG_006546RA [Ceratocystis fimbriata CBS 114723]